MTTPDTITGFWFGLDPKAYFTKDPAFDAELETRFGDDVGHALDGGYGDWAETPDGCMALVLLLDQFTRNIYRGTAKMFAGDARALGVARHALDHGHDKAFADGRQLWFYMPFMHSEDLADQERCIELCTKAGLDDNISYAVEHADIIRRFGRFPHRNELLGRTSTPEEIAFLEAGGFAG